MRGDGDFRERGRDGAERRAGDGDARFEEARAVFGVRSGCGLGRAPRVRRRRVSAGPDTRRRPLTGRRGQGSERRRRKAPRREARAGGSVSGRVKGAKRPSHVRETGAVSKPVPASVARSERERAQGDRDRHPKGEDRVSGLRGAGRGEAAPGGIEPGARSLDRAGVPIMPVKKRAILGRHRPRLRTGHTGNQARNNGLFAVSDTDRGD